MTKADLELLGERLALEFNKDRFRHELNPSGGYNKEYDRSFEAGFTAALELMWPCVERLQYCAIEPGLLHPANNQQHIAAASALAELEGKLK